MKPSRVLLIITALAYLSTVLARSGPKILSDSQLDSALNDDFDEDDPDNPFTIDATGKKVLKNKPEYALVYLYGSLFRDRRDLEQLRRKWIQLLMSSKMDIKIRLSPDQYEFQIASEKGGLDVMHKFALFACDQGETRQVRWRDRAWEQSPAGRVAYQQARIDMALRMKEDGTLKDGHMFSTDAGAGKKRNAKTIDEL